jgi:hypothetical protein
VQLVHNGKKNKPLADRLFYGMIDSAALNAFVIFTENMPNFGECKKDKRKILEGTGPCFDHSTCTSEIVGSAANTARCETGHSQLLSTFFTMGSN